MTGGWVGSDRRQHLPPGWATIRKRVLARDGHRCTATLRNGHRCHDRATDVDHINPGDDHSDSNLRALCAWHHRRKSSSEGGQARQRYTNRRPQEHHPGLT